MDLFSRLERTLRACCPALELRREEPMAEHTSFRLGGPAALMALPADQAEAEAAARTALEAGVRPFYMGNGSNLLVPDAGVRTFVVKTCDGLGEIRREGERTLWAGSGALLSRLSVFARDAGLTGLEFAQGIPGSLGGAVTMNAGAYGGELCQVVVETRFLDETGAARTLSGPEHDFSYRHSAFSDGKRLILASRLVLEPGDPAEIGARMADLAHRRRSKQPLEYPSAGSTFKRPEGHYAAALIEQCGLKGAAVGGAQVSEKHAGFVINRGGATCDDVLRLVELVRETVLRQTGVTLELEVRRLTAEE